MSWRKKLLDGVPIPAHPLALTAERRLDEELGGQDALKVAGVTGETPRAVREAEPAVTLGRWCPDPKEDLSPGQAEAIDRVHRACRASHDDNFVDEDLDKWLR